MLKNADVTLFNESDGKFYPTVFKEVSWRGKTQTATTSNGLVATKTFVIRISEGKESKPYLPFKKWQNLSEEKKSEFWTLQGDNKDYITDEVIETFDSFTEVCKEHNVSRVYSFADNRGDVLSHWRLDAK